MYASQLFLLDARRIRRKARRVYACPSRHVKHSLRSAMARLTVVGCSGVERSNTRSVSASSQVRGMFRPVGKLMSNLWILWKTQDSRLWNLWITSPIPLSVYSLLAIIGGTRRTARIDSCDLDICHSAPNTYRSSPHRHGVRLCVPRRGTAILPRPRSKVHLFHKAFVSGPHFHSPLESSYSKRRLGAAIFRLGAPPRKGAFPRCGKFCG